MNGDTVLHIISKCTNLSRFEATIGERFPGSPNPEFGSVVESTSLQYLSLSFSNRPALTFLNRLDLPDLRELRLIGSARFQDPPSFARFFSVSSKLESVYLRYIESFPPLTLLELFRALPTTIQRLGIEDKPIVAGWTSTGTEPKFDDEFLELLTPTRDGPILCPELRYITAKSCLLVSDAAVLRFIRARLEIASEPTLKRARFQFNREKMHDIRAQLQPFVEAGADISLTYPRHPSRVNSSSYNFRSDDIWEENHSS